MAVATTPGGAAVSGQATVSPGKTIRARLWQFGGNYIVRRIFKALFTVFFVTTLTFFVVRLMPGSPVEAYIAKQIAEYGISYVDAAASAESLFAINPSEPLYVQYFTYLGRLFQGDLGRSLVSSGAPVSQIILQYLPWTLFSVGLGLMLAFTLGIGLGMVMAYKRESLLDLRKRLGFAMIFISHDLAIAAELADRVATMYAGRIIEVGEVRDLFYHPRHPYTVGLLNAVPPITGGLVELKSIPGSPPNLMALPQGCTFHPRCSYMTEECKATDPELVPVGRGHAAACLHHERVSLGRAVVTEAAS